MNSYCQATALEELQVRFEQCYKQTVSKQQPIVQQRQFSVQFVAIVCIILILYIQQMGKTLKSKQCKGRWCQNHLFSITPTIQKNWKTKNQTLRLCPKYDHTLKEFIQTLPLINPDGKYYTPLFIAYEDKKHYAENDQRNRTVFENNRRLQEIQRSQMMVPNVISTRRYCKVCKTEYDDYLQHINSQSHHDKALNNPYSTYISELQEEIHATNKRQTECYLQKRQSFTNIRTYSQIGMDMALSDKQSLMRQIFFEEMSSKNKQ